MMHSKKLKVKNIQEHLKDNKMILLFKPLVGVGDFTLGSDVKKAVKYLEYEFFSKEKDSQSNHYIIKDMGVSLIDNDKGEIEDIICDENCIYKGRNIIGMTIEEFISHTAEKYYGEVDVADFEDDDIPQYIYEFEDIGLQVWEKGKAGKIVTVIVSLPYAEEDDPARASQ
jgi:hypothetical protein